MNFEQTCKKAGLAQVSTGRFWPAETYIVWKPGASIGWIVRPSRQACYCTDCFGLFLKEEDDWRLVQLENIGLDTVSVGKPMPFRSSLDHFEWELRHFGVKTRPLEENEVYKIFMSACATDEIPQT